MDKTSEWKPIVGEEQWGVSFGVKGGIESGDEIGIQRKAKMPLWRTFAGYSSLFGARGLPPFIK